MLWFGKSNVFIFTKIEPIKSTFPDWTQRIGLVELA
jgi:hypothetical protein